jgi:hypothetical protein
MREKLLIAMVGALVLTPSLLGAQAPTGSTGQCKDGSYTTAKTKSGACRGHQGIGTWYADAATSATPSKPASTSTAPAAPMAAAPAPPPAPAATPAGSPASKSKSTPAAGGGPGLVWLNTSSNVYHCYGGEYYGTTKAGKYMTEADAKAAGGRPDHNKPCSAK